MASYTKTNDISLIAWQDITTGNAVISSTQAVTTTLAGLITARMGRRSGTAFTAGWPNIRIEVTTTSSGNDAWAVIAPFTASVGASIANTTLNGAISAGATTAVVTSATNIAAGDLLFLGHTTLTTNYELARVKSISGTTVTFEEAITYAHDNTAPVTDQAEIYYAQIDLTSITRIRAVVDNANSGQTMAARVLLSLGDSIG